ncbi:MAG TPA: Spy/CpxP family protein refolding chaperone [Kiritimatiellia bacterium]|nr:Spy/CpxP family protein refolding chaperone [Kiritimatiellia bacterium]
MNTTRWWCLALVAATALSFSAGRWSADPATLPDPLRNIGSLQLDWLDLTAAQAAEVARIQPPYAHAVKSGCDAQCAARCQLVNALVADTWNADQARAAVEAMCDAHRETELATLDYLGQIHAVLTPEQRTRLMQRVGACLCESCATNGNLCCIPEENP